MIGTILVVLLIWLVVGLFAGMAFGQAVKDSRETEEALREP